MYLADRPLHDKSPYPLSRIQQLELRYKSIRPLPAGVPVSPIPSRSAVMG